MMTAIVIILYFFVIIFDFIPAKKGRIKKENAVYWSFMTISFCVLILYSLDIKVPGPSEPIKSLVEKLFSPSK